MASSILSNATSNRHVQLAATAIVSGAVVAGAILGWQRFSAEGRTYMLKRSIPPPDDINHTSQMLTSYGTLPPPDPDDARTEALARRAQAGDFDEEVIREQLARNLAFLTPAGLTKLRDAFVVVVGAGGVGSHCAAALARSGVGSLRIVDFDQVSLSSLNRHAVATLQDVGSPKVLVLERRLRAATPWVGFDPRIAKFEAASAAALLGPNSMAGSKQEGRRPDFVVDAIDNISTKVELLRYCHEHKLPVVSSMGAGTKSDPTRITVGDISTTTDDGLSRATRRRLKLLGITSGIPVVFSTEKGGEGKAELLPLPEEQFQKGKEAVRELGVIADFRVRILPVLGTMPAVFGYTAANHVILSLTGYPHDYAVAKDREKMYDQILSMVLSSEEKLCRTRFGHPNGDLIGLRLPISSGDISLLAEDIYRGRSAVTQLPTRITLIRWLPPDDDCLNRIGEGEDVQKWPTLRLSDLVCMTKDEATRHQKEVLLGDKTPEDLYDKDVLDFVESRRAEARQYEAYR